MNQVKVKRRAIDGVLLFDKPLGWTSNDAVQKVRRLFNAEKVGHTGTLDPLATGLLPLLFGEATKFSADLLDADKTYRASIRFGVMTATGDLEGEVLQQADEAAMARLNAMSAEELQSVLAQFEGAQQQVPPMYSALKRDGKALYEYAREGVEVEREARDIHIASIQLVEWRHAQVTGEPYTECVIDVTCSKGTYIRVLGEDIGKRLGCGACLSGLRRTAVGSLQMDERVWTLQALTAAEQPIDTGLLAPVDTLLAGLPAIELGPEWARRFEQGQRLPLGPRTEQGRVRVYRSEPRSLMGTALLNNDGAGHTLLCPERLIRH